MKSEKRKKVFRVGFKGKTYLVKNYIECRSLISKIRGLMFRRSDFKTPLVFAFPFPFRYRIHSFFCRRFLAVWIRDGKIIEKKVVEPWKFVVLPKEKVDTLIEIPLS